VAIGCEESGRIVHPEVIHFTCRAEPPGDQRLGFFRRPDWRRICRCFLAASSFPPLSTSVCPSPSVSHNSGAEEPAGELFRTDVPKSRETAKPDISY
jgi:hypothetical protein